MAFIVLILIYCVLIQALLFGFFMLKENNSKIIETHFISVIIPVRNETVITDLSKLDYPSDKYEVIIVDDSDEPLQLSSTTLRSPSPGKKAAITAGVAAAKGEIIVTTDADCQVTSQWLSEINKGFQKPSIKMLVGGVRIQEGQSLFSRLQALEFVSVAITGAATLALGFPTMCNGANLAYRKDAFLAVGGYQGNERITSGDDEFLMNKFNKNSIRYLYSTDSLVTSSPHHLLTSFLSQRLRWAGKWTVNTSIATRIFAVVVWLFHLGFIVMALCAVFGVIPLKLFAILAGAKAFVETLLLLPAANFYRVRWRWITFLCLQFVYSFYVIYTGFMSQILLQKWKGRAVETKV